MVRHKLFREPGMSLDRRMTGLLCLCHGEPPHRQRRRLSCPGGGQHHEWGPRQETPGGAGPPV